jgi:hypothetical protein
MANMDPRQYLVKISGCRSDQKSRFDGIRIPTLLHGFGSGKIFDAAPAPAPTQLQSKSKFQKQTDKLLCYWYYLFNYKHQKLTELELHGVAAPAPKNDVDLQHRF